MTALAALRPVLNLTVRRERFRSSAWYLTTGAVLSGIAAGIAKTYPTLTSRAQLARSVNVSSGERFVIGPIHGTDIGNVASWRLLGVASLAMGVASALTVVRNTRTAEEDGTRELLAPGAGRAAPLVSALTVATTGSLAAGLVTATGVAAVGGDRTGSLLTGAQVASFGLVSAAVSAMAAQLVRSPRGATACAIGATAAFFCARGAGDVLGGWGAWVSPFGWVTAVQPFAARNPVMFLPVLALTGVLAGCALAISARRDLGAALIGDRPGPRYADPHLRGPVSLAWRTTRAATLGWSVTGAALGVLIGALASTVDDQAHLELGSGGSGLLAMTLYLAPLAAALLGVQIALRLRDEVTSGRAEHLLARPVSRARWLLSYPAAGGVASTVLLLAIGAGLAIGQLPAGRYGPWQLVIASVARTPAAWVLIAVTTFLLATAPRAAALVSYALIAGYEILELAVEFSVLPAAALRISPFAMVPQLPDGALHPLATAVMLTLTAALCAVAARAVRHLDVD